MSAPHNARGDMTILEDWVDKESRHFGTWRRRWLVVYRWGSTQLPYALTYKRSRDKWDRNDVAPQPMMAAPRSENHASTS